MARKVVKQDHLGNVTVEYVLEERDYKQLIEKAEQYERITTRLVAGLSPDVENNYDVLGDK